MDMQNLSSKLKKLAKNQYMSVYSNRGVEIKVQRTERFGPEDFVIELHNQNGKIQIPHVVLFSDLDTKMKSDPSDASKLFCVIEKINQGDDPALYSALLSNLTFSSGVYEADIIAYCTQLMMIEQDFNYGPGRRKTYFTPPREFFMHYIRWIRSQNDNISKINKQANKKRLPPKQYYKKLVCDDV